MDPAHWKLATGRKSLCVGLISKLKIVQQLDLTQVSRETIPGNWLFTSGNFMS
jgi:hypothetical protein